MDHKTPRMRSLTRFVRLAGLAGGVMAPLVATLALAAPASALELYAHWYVNGVRLTEAKPITMKGSFVLHFTRFTEEGTGEKVGYTVSCNDTGTGKAGPGEEGETTSWKTSGCVSNEKLKHPHECKSASVNIGTHKTVLLGLGGIKYEDMGGLELVCEGKEVEYCGIPVDESLTNTSLGVDGELPGKSSDECIDGPDHQEAPDYVEGHQEIKASSGLLEVKYP